MDTKKTPKEKLECLMESTKIMSDVINLTSNSGSGKGADEFLPLTIYILLKA